MTALSQVDERQTLYPSTHSFPFDASRHRELSIDFPTLQRSIPPHSCFANLQTFRQQHAAVIAPALHSHPVRMSISIATWWLSLFMCCHVKSLGVFDVNVPIIWGSGKRVFNRSMKLGWLYATSNSCEQCPHCSSDCQLTGNASTRNSITPAPVALSLSRLFRTPATLVRHIRSPSE